MMLEPFNCVQIKLLVLVEATQVGKNKGLNRKKIIQAR